MGRLEGKRCLITGGGKGIGRAIALAFAAEGADVAIIDRNQASMEEAVTGIKALGAKTIGAQADVSDAASAQSAVEKAAAALGGIDVLVKLFADRNDAGRDVGRDDGGQCPQCFSVLASCHSEHES
jgi:NAD(P)-dependent dehydrogenase (short-subunit alcohol dehydrogenase family)